MGRKIIVICLLILAFSLSVLVHFNSDYKNFQIVEFADDGRVPSESVRHSAEPTPHLIILFAYMRGGSTFTGRLLGMHPNVFYWYEFLWDVYNAMLSSTQISTIPSALAFDQDFKYLRKLTTYERDFIRNQTRLMANCEFSSMPYEVTTSWTQDISLDSHLKYRHCLAKYSGYNIFMNRCHVPLGTLCKGPAELSFRNKCHLYMEQTRLALSGKAVDDMDGFPPVHSYLNCSEASRNATNACVSHLVRECRTRPIKAMKVLRSNMTLMYDIRHDLPGVKVIHLLRDPRGIVMSRSVLNWFKGPFNATKEARLLCTKMLEDIRQRRELEKMHPGISMEVMYESIAQEPLANIERLYDFAKIPMFNSTRATLQGMTSASSKIATSWRQKISDETKRQIDAECKDLYEATHYVV